MLQVGVLVSRSSVHCVPVPRLWPLPVLQGANSATALLLVLLYGKAGRGGSMTPLLGLMALVMWEGLLGGATYVNAYTQISKARHPASAFCNCGRAWSICSTIPIQQRFWPLENFFLKHRLHSGCNAS